MEWKMVYAHHQECRGREFKTIKELMRSGFECISASVPGCLETELMRTGKVDDLYYSTNVLRAQQLEDVHVWYYTLINIENAQQYLRFEGIDTYADIYVNGRQVAASDNMFLPCEVEADWKTGENEVVVHIRPTMLEARKYTPPVTCNAQKYNYASLYVRKAAHMFGWDIMPRIVSAGLWKEVNLLERKKDKIQEVYFGTYRIRTDANRVQTASVRFYMNADLGSDLVCGYSVKIEGKCGKSHFEHEEQLWHNTHMFSFRVEDCMLWWPKNAGKANLYDITVSLLKDGKICDSYQFRAGIRTIELERTDSTDREGNGDFCFIVNGKRIFILGTNWVPLDAFHCNDNKRLRHALELLDDIGCNMVRCWGGNVYESDAFFDYCDLHGIMVWQDFAMGCAVYPNEEEFASRLEKEAIFQVKRLRNHPSLAVWAGDNECDEFSAIPGFRQDPNRNSLTRKLLKRVVELHDGGRPYLPSSPFISEAVFQGKGSLPEKHIWGPRDYFKGPYYKDSFCHFASETGYQGLPSPNSLRRFLKEPEKFYISENESTDEYVLHSSSPEPGNASPYAFRSRLCYKQVETLFGKAEENLDDFARQSQISQAEAVKYFIEKFRIDRKRRTGIIWWNLLDGWPQVSDAVVDYYFTKKLAYSYIKRSQEAVCLMFDEPEDGNIQLVGVNDLPENVDVTYTVRRTGTVVMTGKVSIPAESAVGVGRLAIREDEQEFYLIEWDLFDRKYKNHYFTNMIDIDYRKYMKALRQVKMDDFEGF